MRHIAPAPENYLSIQSQSQKTPPSLIQGSMALIDFYKDSYLDTQQQLKKILIELPDGALKNFILEKTQEILPPSQYIIPTQLTVQQILRLLDIITDHINLKNKSDQLVTHLDTIRRKNSELNMQILQTKAEIKQLLGRISQPIPLFLRISMLSSITTTQQERKKALLSQSFSESTVSLSPQSRSLTQPSSTQENIVSLESILLSQCIGLGMTQHPYIEQLVILLDFHKKNYLEVKRQLEAVFKGLHSEQEVLAILKQISSSHPSVSAVQAPPLHSQVAAIFDINMGLKINIAHLSKYLTIVTKINREFSNELILLQDQKDYLSKLETAALPTEAHHDESTDQEQSSDLFQDIYQGLPDLPNSLDRVPLFAFPSSESLNWMQDIEAEPPSDWVQDISPESLPTSFQAPSPTFFSSDLPQAKRARIEKNSDQATHHPSLHSDTDATYTGKFG